MSGLANAGLLMRRSVVRLLRQPANIVFAFVFPLLLLAVNAGGLNAATRIPGFPSNTYVTFALAVPFVQGALFASNIAGTNVAQDIESGFLSRLALTPITRTALLAGQLAGVMALGVAQAVVYLAVGEAAGAGQLRADQPAARPDSDRLVPNRRHLQPGFLPA